MTELRSSPKHSLGSHVAKLHSMFFDVLTIWHLFAFISFELKQLQFVCFEFSNSFMLFLISDFILISDLPLLLDIFLCLKIEFFFIYNFILFLFLTLFIFLHLFFYILFNIFFNLLFSPIQYKFTHFFCLI